MRIDDAARKLKDALGKMGYRASLKDIQTYLDDYDALCKWLRNHPDVHSMKELDALDAPYYQNAHKTRLYADGCAYVHLVELHHSMFCVETV